ncbi:MAG TPA: DUF190 domain-containing protein, partial [Rectinemataceae bacterium]|nr:DUF190 domain-containing protein [Rectinemataceae bacterium]
RGVEGCYESGETVTARIMDLSYNLPIVVDIVLPKPETERVVERLEAMVLDGTVAVLPAEVTSHRSPARLLPPSLLVRDVMVPKPVMARPDFSVRVAAELLLDSDVKALPVADNDGLLIGLVTQRDLIERAGMPARIGLFGLLPRSEVDAWRRSSDSLPLVEVMTSKPHSIRADHKLSEALHLMLRRSIKRLPVVDDQGRVVGMLSRNDILKTLAVMRAPGAAAPGAAVSSGGLADPVPKPEGHSGFVRDLALREALSFPVSLGIKDAIDRLANSGLLQAAVVDREGRLLGLISDELLLGAIDARRSLFPLKDFLRSRRRRGTAVGEIMRTDIVTVTEDSRMDEVLQLMSKRGIKRLPVIDSEGVFRGMIHRDSILVALSHAL